MKTLAKLLAIPAFISFCGLALLANETADATGKYDQADQFLSSIYK